jgi:hypothetical protein
VTNCKATNNYSTGIFIGGHCHCSFDGQSNDYAFNGNNIYGAGIAIVAMCDVGFGSNFVGTIRNNGQFGAQVSWNSYLDNAHVATFTANPLGSYQIFNNSYVYN